MRVVLCCGVFDLLHVAHIEHLSEARGMGEWLVVGVTRDSGVGKGHGRPVIPEDERAECVVALYCVSQVILCDDSIDALERIKPHVFCKGSDYLKKGLLDSELKFCHENGVDIRYTKPHPRTTSSIIERIKCAS